MNSFKFIDLFCGVGGFHQALSALGGKCILACDVDKKAIEVYEKNYGIKVHNDITTIDEKTVEDFDFLCAGFPCQSFSKCGNRGGLEDARGTLFFHILRILKEKKPKYILLENVVNLIHHDGGNSYKVIVDSLKEIGYALPATPLILSPDQFDTPQKRRRVFFPGILDIGDKSPLVLNISTSKLTTKFEDIADKQFSPGLKIAKKFENTINAWDEFFQYYISNKPFGPRNMFLECIYNNYPLKIRQKHYKKSILAYYTKHKVFMDAWVLKYNMLKKPITHQHWLFHEIPQVKSLWDCIIQPRANGFIYTQTDICPTLVKSGISPIYGKERRHLSADEYRKLQDFPTTFIQHTNPKVSYNQFGNSVNVKVVKGIVEELLKISLPRNNDNSFFEYNS